MKNNKLVITLAEEDTIFRMMETAINQELNAEGEKALRYFFGPDYQAAFKTLIEMPEQVGLPRDMEATVCQDEDSLSERLPYTDLMVVEKNKITRSHLEKASSNLLLIQKFGRDCDNIDVAAAKDLGFKVARMIRFSTFSSAEHALALIMALARRLIDAHESVIGVADLSVEPAFDRGPAKSKFNWLSIKGIKVLAKHTLGFIGMGENAGEVAKRANALGMKVYYYKRRQLKPEEEKEFGIEYLTLDELLAKSDFLSLNIPYNRETEKMVDKEFLGKMKDTAYLINTSRGGIVDEEALYEALKAKTIAGAALDVYRYEPIPSNCPLLRLKNIIWSPHMSGGEPEFMLQEVLDVLTNLAKAYRGETPDDLLF